jgi:hypothetical protein
MWRDGLFYPARRTVKATRRSEAISVKTPGGAVDRAANEESTYRRQGPGRPHCAGLIALCLARTACNPLRDGGEASGEVVRLVPIALERADRWQPVRSLEVE